MPDIVFVTGPGA